MPVDNTLLMQVSLKVTGADVHQFGVVSPHYRCAMGLSEDPEVDEKSRAYWAKECRNIEEDLRAYLATGDSKLLRARGDRK